MDLSGHKNLCGTTKKMLEELKRLVDAQKLRPESWVLTVNGEFEIPMPLEYAETAWREYIWALEAKAKEQASVFGY